MKRVAILRGGSHDNYASSLKEGGDMLRFLADTFSHKYRGVDIFVDRDGVWHINGRPTKPWDLIDKVDMVWDTLGSHASKVFDNLGIPKVGRGDSSHLLTTNRALLANTLSSLGVRMLKHMVIPAYQSDFDGELDRYVLKKAKEVHQKFGAPWLIKSFNNDPSVGIRVAKTYPELINALEELTVHGDSILVEELISGKEVKAHSLANYRGRDVYVFPFERVTREENSKLLILMERLHQQLGARDYFHANFIIHPRGMVYATHINFLPDLTEESHLHNASESIGAKLEHIIEHILERP